MLTTTVVREEVIRIPTLDDIKAMTPGQRRNLYDNAAASKLPEAKSIVDLILENQLLTTDSGGLPREHPIIQEIEDIACSAKGRQAAREASDAGLPALAGVDPLLVAALGSSYGSMDTTGWAGTFVAQEMESMGYRQTRKKPMPKGCVAKTAAFFEPKLR